MRNPRRRRLSAAFGAVVMLLTLGVTTVLADSPNPSSVQAQVNGNTVTLTGTWNWDRNQCDAVNDRYVGWEVDWDDPNAPGHLVPGKLRNYFVGTPTDNTIDTHGDCGTQGGPGVQGTWGPISHTYSGPGQYEICVITYDIHRGDEGKLGGHGLVAGGPDRNKDNSVEKNSFEPRQGGVDCAPITITIDDKVSARKTVDKAVANPGDVLTYTLTVTGGSQAAVNDVTISDDISPLLARGTLVAGSTNPTATQNGNTLSWSGQNFAIGQTRTYTFQVRLNDTGWPAGQTSLPNTVVVTKSNCVQGSNDPNCTTTTTVTPNPGIQITKTPDAQSVVAGNPVGFTIRVSSNGQSAATNVVVTDSLPTLPNLGINWSISPAVAGCSISGAAGNQSLNCDFGTLNPGQSREVHIVSNTTAPQGGQTIAQCQTTVTNFATNLNNSATVNSSAGSSTAQTGTCVTGTPHLTVTKTPDSQSVVAGNPVGFTITVTSDGSVTANNVQITDQLPTSNQFGPLQWQISPANNDCALALPQGGNQYTLSCNFGNLATGQSRSVHVVANTTAPAAGAQIAPCQVTVTTFATNLNNSVQATSSNASSATAQTGVCVTNAPHVSVTKTPDAQTVTAGNPVGFTITVTSDGQGTATNVSLTDALPTLAGLGINWSISPAVAGCSITGAAPTQTLSCNFGDLAQGQSRTVHVTSPTTAPTGNTTIAACQQTVTNFATNLNNSVQVTSQNAGSATAQTGTCVTGNPRLTVTKTPDAQTVVAGNPVGFTITVTSSGSGTATNVQLTDALPTLANAGINWSINPAVAGCSITGAAPSQTLSCNFGDLPAGATRSVHVTSPTTAPTGNQTLAPCQITTTTFATNLNNSVQVTSQSAQSATAQTGLCVTTNPHVSVTKTPDAANVLAGNPVGFTITVTSDGTGTATGVTVTDSLPGNAALGVNWTINPAVAGCSITGAAPTQTLTCNFGDMAQGATRSVHVTSPTTAPQVGGAIAPCAVTVVNYATNLNNQVQVTSQNGGSSTAVTGICVSLNEDPAIQIVKVANPTTLPAGGGSVTYSYTVRNVGNVPLTNVTVVDDKCSPVNFVGGDANGNNTLEVTETWTYQCTQTITVTTTNTALATGFRNNTPVTDTDTAVVTVANATPSPTGSVQIATSPPRVTLPPTDADPTGQNGGANSGTSMLLILLAGIAVAAPLLAVGRRRNQVR